MNILCLCLSANIQRTLSFTDFSLDSVNRTSDFREDASGKAINSARVLNQLEKNSAKIICPVGLNNKKRFLQLIKKDDLKIYPVYIPGNTRECWTLLSKNGTTTEVIGDEPSSNAFSANKIENQIISLVTRHLKNCDALLFAGSRPKHFSESICQKICTIAKSMNKFLLVDFKGKDLISVTETCKPDFIKINEEEFISTFLTSESENNSLSRTDFDLEKEISSVSKKLNSVIIITRGEKETIAADNGKLFLCPSERITPINTIACGDSFNAGFIFEYLNSGSLDSALKKGTFCAARNAESKIPGSIKN